MTGDGLELVFSANSRGNEEIYLSTRPSRESSFGKGRRLGEPVNATKGVELDPTVSPNGLSLIVCSWTSAGGVSKLFTRTSRDMEFTEGESLGPIVNAGHLNVVGAISGDGTALATKVWAATGEETLHIVARVRDQGPLTSAQILAPQFSGMSGPPACIARNGSRIYFVKGTKSKSIWYCDRVPLLPDSSEDAK